MGCGGRAAVPALPLVDDEPGTTRSPVSASRAATWCRPIMGCGTIGRRSAPSRLPPPTPVGGAGGDCCGVDRRPLAPPPYFLPALPASPLTFARAYDPALPASALAAPAARRAGSALPKPKICVARRWRRERGVPSRPAQPRSAATRLRDRDRARRHRVPALRRRRISAPRPSERRQFSARFRIGNGSVGNVGPDTLGHVLTADDPRRTGAQPACRRAAGATPTRWRRSASAHPGHSARSFAR